MMEDNSHYRLLNLELNHIFLRPLHEKRPEYIDSLIHYISRDCSVNLSPDQIRQSPQLNDLWMSGVENDVQDYFYQHVFPGESDGLRRIRGMPMANDTIPNSAASQFLITQPKT